MSGDAEQDYFVDGMVEDIITGLSRIKWLFVIARNSSFAYKGQSPDIRQVGRELGVRYVLEGSVRKAAARVRITGQLVEAETGRHIWAERYDKRKRPENLDAYDLVLRATPLVVVAMPETALRALPMLERALTLEPDYALAHGHAAFCYENLFVRAGSRDEHRQGAIRHAHAAIAYGRDDATALTLGGFNLGMIEHDRAAASEAFEAAIVLSPSSAFAYILGSIQLGFAGDVERAIEWGERGLRLSPRDVPRSFPGWALRAGDERGP